MLLRMVLVWWLCRRRFFQNVLRWTEGAEGRNFRPQHIQKSTDEGLIRGVHLEQERLKGPWSEHNSHYEKANPQISRASKAWPFLSAWRSRCSICLDNELLKVKDLPGDPHVYKDIEHGRVGVRPQIYFMEVFSTMRVSSIVNISKFS